jgi:hypothetical protein
VQLIARLSKAKQASGVYAFDAIYEKSTSKTRIVVMVLSALKAYDDRPAQVPQLGRLPEIYRGDRDISRALCSRSQVYSSRPSSVLGPRSFR